MGGWLVQTDILIEILYNFISSGFIRGLGLQLLVIKNFACRMIFCFVCSPFPLVAAPEILLTYCGNAVKI
jgi:hypothetical protein